MLKRLLNVIAAFFNMFTGKAEQMNPEAMLELEKEHLRSSQAQFNDGLSDLAAQSELLMNQIQAAEKRVPQLNAQVELYLRKGDRVTAGTFAKQLEDLKVSIDDQHKTLAMQEDQYKKLTAGREAAVRDAQARIESIKSSLTDAKMKEAAANLTEMANNMVSQIGSSSDTLQRLEEQVNNRRAKASGRARVAMDSQASITPGANEEVQSIVAEDALSRFEAKKTPTLPAPSAPDPIFSNQSQPQPVERKMGQ